MIHLTVGETKSTNLSGRTPVNFQRTKVQTFPESKGE